MIKSTLLNIWVILILIGCEKEIEYIYGNGTNDTLKINEKEFNNITVLGDYFQVFTHIYDPHYNLVLEGESNILDVMWTHLMSEELWLQTLEDVNIAPSWPIKIDVYTPSLTSIKLYGDSDISTDSIFSEHFRIFSRGAGRIEATISTDSLVVDAFNHGIHGIYGTAKKGYFNIHEGVMLYSNELKQDSCFVSLIGFGEVYVNAEIYLEVKIEGDGTVYYIGEPTVVSEINGSGKIIHQ